MKVTEVQIYPIKPRDGLVAFATIIFDDALYLSSIGVHKKLHHEGYRITYPTRKVGERTLDVFHPITAQAGQEIEKAIVEKARKILE